MSKAQNYIRFRRFFVTLCALFLSLTLLGGCASAGSMTSPDTSTEEGVLSPLQAAQEYALDEEDLALRSDDLNDAINSDAIPAYIGVDVIELDDNIPQFTDVEKDYAPFEFYGDLDDLGRCTVAFALAGPETMPTERRGDIREVYPSGWNQAFYDFVDQEALFNRTHLIGYMLTAENANERNLITGTRHMNAEVMLPYEEAVADYITETGNHVLYRVTPYFVGDELVARGIQMEAYSVEDNGAGVCFNIFCYNVEPGVEIDYRTGESWLADEESSSTSRERVLSDSASPDSTSSASQDTSDKAKQSDVTYVLNTKSHKFHQPDCPSVRDISSDNRQDYEGSREALVSQGYAPCGSCNP